MFTEGVIEIPIREDFTNTTAPLQREPEVIPVDFSGIYITGPDVVDCFKQYIYRVNDNVGGGQWSVSDSKLAKIVSTENNSVVVGIISKKAGTFTLTYTYDITETAEFKVTIRSI